jgi:hypothetical protein
VLAKASSNLTDLPNLVSRESREVESSESGVSSWGQRTVGGLRRRSPFLRRGKSNTESVLRIGVVEHGS